MNTKLGLFAAAVLGVAGCAGMSVKSNTAPGTDLAQYRTYSWYTPPVASRGKAETIAEQEIKGDLIQALNTRGFTRATNNPPNFLVAYHVTEKNQAEVTDWGYGWGPGWGPVDVTSYEVGTLVVDFIDPATNKVFWRGTGSEVVNNPSNPDPKKIATVVTKIIDQYPYNVAAVPTTPTM